MTVGVPGRPFPPGAYPVVVIGSGPGGLQVSHALSEVGIEHAVISQDPSPGGMFRRWPFFQRLLSWTKPHAPVEHDTRAYERYDWNSLLTMRASAQALQPTLMDGSSYFPSRPEMEANLAAFAERARYVQPYEDHVLGGGVSLLNASTGSIEKLPDGALRAHLHRSDGGGDIAIDADEIIAATGFTAPLLDLPKLGCQVFGASRLPVQTPWWESATLPGVFFAGTLGQGARGLRKHGIPSNSGAVHGARYNARVLARRLAEDRFGIGIHRPVMEPETLIDFLTTEIADAPDLFHQRAYLARVVAVDPSGRLRDSGVLPLAHAVDAGGENAIMVTLEADGSGAIYPVLYSRIDGAVNEHPLEPDPLLRYDGAETRAAIASVVGPVLRASGIALPAN